MGVEKEEALRHKQEEINSLKLGLKDLEAMYG